MEVTAGCPACLNAEQELKNTISQAAYATANPGDYDCPHCKYRTLRADASRCPLCQGEIGGDYWNAVRAREKAAAEQKRALEEKAAAEWIRTAPERAAAAAEAQRLNRNADSIGNAVSGAGYGAVLGGTVIGLLGFVSCLSNIKPTDAHRPGFNLFNGLLWGAIVGAVIGVVVGILIGQKKI